MSHIRGGISTQGPPQQHGNNKGMVVGAVVYNPNPQMAPPTAPPTILKPGGAAGMPGMMAGKSENQPSFNGNVAGTPLSDQPEQSENSLLANTKEKTPMCLINELARYNKIQHHYTLVDEQGPAHKKTFFVKLKLGDEECSCKGPSIKKAQHAAAAIALEKTNYKHPPPRPKKIMPVNGGYKYLYTGKEGPGACMQPIDLRDDFISEEFCDKDNNITPTVQLNALAMKRCERPIYTPIEPQRPHYYQHPNHYDYRGMYNQRYHYPRVPKIFYVSLKIGQREFIGEGHSRQAARHCAAEKALKVLGSLPLPNQDVIKPVKAPEVDGETDPDDLKSEISLVHEIGIKRGLKVDFKVTHESGQPHMRCFTTQCSVGDLVTKGDGNGKKVSKKVAAKAMLEELRKLGPLPNMTNTNKLKQKNPVNKKKNRNLIKMQKACPDYGLGINPISRLIQIQQAKKEKDPIYTLKEEKGQPRKREFVMQVQVGSHIAQGLGPNKRFAKRAAAEAMLQLLGYSKPSPQPDKPALKTGVNGGASSPNDLNKKVTFVDQDHTVGRQLVPGVILMPGSADIGGGLNRAPGGPIQMGDTSVSPRTTAVIAKELLDKGASPTAEALRKAGARPPTQHVVQPKMQLLYLAEVLGFQVQFTDFPKGNNKNEFLSLVSLSTNPPQVSHGAGITIEASHDAAALTALRSLAEMGIDSVTDTKSMKKDLAAGDAPHQKDEKKVLAAK